VKGTITTDWLVFIAKSSGLSTKRKTPSYSIGALIGGT